MMITGSDRDGRLMNRRVERDELAADLTLALDVTLVDITRHGHQARLQAAARVDRRLPFTLVPSSHVEDVSVIVHKRRLPDARQ